jgi:hypothetical protein
MGRRFERLADQHRPAIYAGVSIDPPIFLVESAVVARSVLEYLSAVAKHKANVWMGVECCDDLRQGVSRELIVMVEFDEDLTFGNRACIPLRGSNAHEIVLNDDMNSGILDLRPPPCALVEYDDPLPVTVRLHAQTPETLIKKARAMARGEHTHARLGFLGLTEGHIEPL